MHESTELFRALGDPTRLAVFDCVARREMTVSELTSRFDVSQPAISQHLAALRMIGLVSQRRVGRYVYYRANPAGMKPLVHWLRHYQAFWKERMPRLGKLLKEMKDEREPGRQEQTIHHSRVRPAGCPEKSLARSD